MKLRLARLLLLELTLALVFAAPARANDIYQTYQVTLQNAVSATGNGTAMDVGGLAAVSLDVSGTFTATVNFQGTGNSGTFTAINCFNQSTTPPTVVQSTTATGTFLCGVAGLQQVRATVTWTSGTSVTVKGVGTTSAPSTAQVAGTVGLTGAIPTGANTIGAVTQASGPWTSNVTQFGGNNVATGTGAGGVGIPRVTISNDSSLAANQSVNANQLAGSGIVSTVAGELNTLTCDKTTSAQCASVSAAGALKVDNSAVTQPVNCNLAGVACSTGNGVSGTGTQRVNIASDNTAFSVNAVQSTAAALSGKWPVQVTDGTNTLPTGDVASRGISVNLGTGGTALPTAAALADAAANPTTTQVGTNASLFNGTTWDRQRAIGSANSALGTARVSYPVADFTLTNSSSGGQATASQAAGAAGVKHCATSVAGALASITATITANQALLIRDGASGAGTIIFQQQMAINTALDNADTFGITFPSPICGTAATAMTVEFAAGVTSVTETVNLSGFDVK